MEVRYEKYGFYTIDTEYLKYLYSKDTEVFYSEAKGYERKPYLGLLARLGKHLYCIPLTSAKQTHLNWKNITEHNYLIYENVFESELRDNDIFKQIDKTEIYKKLLAVLEIKKMIPVDETLCKFIKFTEVTDKDYLSLLQKEYRFLIPHKDSILDKAKTMYLKQKETGKVKYCYCSFSLLEDAYESYSNPSNKESD